MSSTASTSNSVLSRAGVNELNQWFYSQSPSTPLPNATEPQQPAFHSPDSDTKSDLTWPSASQSSGHPNNYIHTSFYQPSIHQDLLDDSDTQAPDELPSNVNKVVGEGRTSYSHNRLEYEDEEDNDYSDECEDEENSNHEYLAQHQNFYMHGSNIQYENNRSVLSDGEDEEDDYIDECEDEGDTYDRDRERDHEEDSDVSTTSNSETNVTDPDNMSSVYFDVDVHHRPATPMQVEYGGALGTDLATRPATPITSSFSVQIDIYSNSSEAPLVYFDDGLSELSQSDELELHHGHEHDLPVSPNGSIATEMSTESWPASSSHTDATTQSISEDEEEEDDEAMDFSEDYEYNDSGLEYSTLDSFSSSLYPQSPPPAVTINFGDPSMFSTVMTGFSTTAGGGIPFAAFATNFTEEDGADMYNPYLIEDFEQNSCFADFCRNIYMYYKVDPSKYPHCKISSRAQDVKHFTRPAEITAQDMKENGCDMQAIPWGDLEIDRARARNLRNGFYTNYANLKNHAEPEKVCSSRPVLLLNI